jgi:hypothetical protein
MALFAEDGSPLKGIDDASVPQLVLGGKAFFPRNAQVGVVSPTGEHFLAPVEKAHSLFGQGWSYEGDEAMARRKAEEAQAGAAGGAKAFVEGAADVATLGSSSILENALLGNAAEQEARARAHPIAHGAGVAAGAFGPALVGDEASPLALLTKGGEAIESAVGKGIVGSAARGAAEFGVMGGTEELKQEVLHNQPADIQKILGAAGTDALYGGGLGSIFHVFGAVGRGALGLAGVAAPAAVNPGTLEAVQDAVAARAEADPTTIWGKLADFLSGGKDRRAAMGRLTGDAGLRRLAFMADSDAELAVIDAAKALSEHAEDFNKAAWKVRDTIKRPAIDAGLEAVDPQIARQKMIEAIDQIQAEIGRMNGNPQEFFGSSKIKLMQDQVDALKKVAGIQDEPMMSLLDQLNGGAPTAGRTLSETVPTAKSMFDALDAARGNFDLIAKLGEAVPAIERPAATVASQIRYRTLKELLENPDIWGDAGAAQQRFNRLHAKWLDGQEDFLKAFGRVEGYQGGKPVFDIDPKKLKSFAGGVGTAGSETHRAALLNYLEQSKAIGDELAGDQALEDRLTSTFKATADVANLARAKADLSKLSASAGEATGVLGSPLGRAFLGHMIAGPFGAAAGIASLAPARIPAILHMLDEIAGARRAEMSLFARAFARGIRPALRRTPIASLKALESVRFTDRTYDKPADSLSEATARRVSELRQLQADPARRLALARKAVSPIAADDPKVAAQILQQGEKSFAWLSQQLPKEQRRGILDNDPTPIPPSNSEQEDFAEAVRVATDPMKAVEDLARGRLTIKGSEAIRAVAPELHLEVLTAVMREVRSSGKPLDYQARLQFSLFAGQPVEDTLQVPFVVAMQSGYASMPGQAPGAEGAEGQAGKPPKLKSSKDLRSANAASSAMDLLEFRRQTGEDTA